MAGTWRGVPGDAPSHEAVELAFAARAFLDRLQAVVATARSACDAGDLDAARVRLAAVDAEIDWVFDVLTARAAHQEWRATHLDRALGALVHLIDGLVPLSREIDGAPD